MNSFLKSPHVLSSALQFSLFSFFLFFFFFLIKLYFYPYLFTTLIGRKYIDRYSRASRLGCLTRLELEPYPSIIDTGWNIFNISRRGRARDIVFHLRRGRGVYKGVSVAVNTSSSRRKIAVGQNGKFTRGSWRTTRLNPAIDASVIRGDALRFVFSLSAYEADVERKTAGSNYIYVDVLLWLLLGGWKRKGNIRYTRTWYVCMAVVSRFPIAHDVRCGAHFSICSFRDSHLFSRTSYASLRISGITR